MINEEKKTLKDVVSELNRTLYVGQENIAEDLRNIRDELRSMLEESRDRDFHSRKTMTISTSDPYEFDQLAKASKMHSALEAIKEYLRGVTKYGLDEASEETYNKVSEIDDRIREIIYEEVYEDEY